MRRSPPPVKVHPFVEGEFGRCKCGYPSQNRRHNLEDLPETPADVREHEARRVGEKSE